MKQCPFCGAEITENARFCLYCMARLTETAPAQTPSKHKIRWWGVLTAVFVLCAVLCGSLWARRPTDANGEAVATTTTTAHTKATPTTTAAATSRTADTTTVTTTAETAPAATTTTRRRAATAADYDTRYSTVSPEKAVVITGFERLPASECLYIPATVDGKTVVGLDMRQAQGIAFDIPTVCRGIRALYLPPTINRITYDLLIHFTDMTDLYIGSYFLYLPPRLCPPKGHATELSRYTRRRTGEAPLLTKRLPPAVPRSTPPHTAYGIRQACIRREHYDLCTVCGHGVADLPLDLGLGG